MPTKRIYGMRRHIHWTQKHKYNECFVCDFRCVVCLCDAEKARVAGTSQFLQCCSLCFHNKLDSYARCHSTPPPPSLLYYERFLVHILSYANISMIWRQRGLGGEVGTSPYKSFVKTRSHEIILPKIGRNATWNWEKLRERGENANSNGSLFANGTRQHCVCMSYIYLQGIIIIINRTGNLLGQQKATHTQGKIIRNLVEML